MMMTGLTCKCGTLRTAQGLGLLRTLAIDAAMEKSNCHVKRGRSRAENTRGVTKICLCKRQM